MKFIYFAKHNNAKVKRLTSSTRVCVSLQRHVNLLMKSMHEIKIQLIERCLSTRVRRKALREEAITLEGLLKYGRSLELSELQAGELEKTNEHSDSINALNKNTDRFKKSHPSSNKIKTEQRCFYRGSYPHPGGKTSCPLPLERNVGGVAAWVILRRCVELNTQVSQVHLAVTEEV